MRSRSCSSGRAPGRPATCAASSTISGHFLHGTWTWSTDGPSAKARHLAARPAVSVAHIDNEELAVFAHGAAEQLRPADPLWDETLAHWTAHHGGSPLEWGEDIRLWVQGCLTRGFA